MTIELTAEQERRIRAAVDRGCYSSAEEVLSAALAVVDAASQSDFDGSETELEALLSHGLASNLLSEDEFWASYEARRDALLEERVRQDP